MPLITKLEFISIDSSSDDDDDASLQYLFKSNIMKMNSNDDYFVDKEDSNVEILPVLLLSLFTRKTKWQHRRLAWLDHVQKLQHEDMFTRTYQMSLEAFGALVKLLYGNISYDYSKYGYISSQEPIFAEIPVAIGLCWLVGGAHILT